MSVTPEQSADLIAVACVVEGSVVLANEWNRILMDYVFPLLKRLNELHPSHQFRLAFVAYGAADTRPKPLLSTRFFAPLSQVTKELREDPSRLGIGQTNSGSGRGLSALEGLVAAIELFDTLMMSPMLPQKENRSLVSHLLHIAASPPDNAQRPQYNTREYLDFVNWDSIPAELKKRKINLSLISLTKVTQFQDLQSSVAGPTAQSPWFNVRAPHVLLLSGFPPPQQKTSIKRLPDATPSDQSPDAKRQKVAAEPISKTSSTSPALLPARISPSQRAQQTIPTSLQAQPPQPTTTLNQNLSSTQLSQVKTSTPASTSATATPSVPVPPSGPSIPVMNAEVLEQIVNPTGLKFGQMMERLKALERDIITIESQISSAQSAGQVAIVAELRKGLAPKAHIKEQIKTLLRQHYQKFIAISVQRGITGPASGSTEAGPAIQSQPPNVPSMSGDRPTGPTTEEHKPTVSDSQIVAQFWQSRGGSIQNANNPQMGSQIPLNPTITPEVEKRGIRPVNFGPSGPMSHVTNAVNSNAQQQLIQPPAWQGTFSWTFPKLSGQATNEIHVIGVFTPAASINIRTDAWPKSLILHLCKEPLKDKIELSTWLKRHRPQTHLMQFRSNPRAPDGPVNEQKFSKLNKFMDDRLIYVYAGWKLPSGKFSYNIVIFSMGNYFAGAVFPDGLPDLPGSGNTMDFQPSVDEVKPSPFAGMNIPPALMAHIQSLDPAKQKQFIMRILRRQQEQARQQQLQQQQPVPSASQNLNPHGMPLPSNPYNMIPNMPTGLLGNPNVAGPANSGTYNAGGGNVNFEMMQSFMQRNAEGSASQGMSMNSGQMS